MIRKEKREKIEEINFFEEFLKIQNHFFKELVNKLKHIKDKRNQSYITYPPEVLLFMIIMKNSCGIVSMNDMTNKFNKENCINNMFKALKIKSTEEIPHYDTINNFLKELEPSELEKIIKYMVKELLNKRCLEKYRLRDKYWKIAIDATGIFSFKHRHCEHCLKREYKNKETGEIERVEYYHNVLEAKLIVGDMAISIATEFIENEKEDVEKQDCELKAFKRLEKRLKNEYKRLPICILADSLYANKSVFEICKNNRWQYIIRFKEGSIKSIAEEFNVISKLEGNKDNNVINQISEKNTKKEVIKDIKYTYVNSIDYVEYKINEVEYTSKYEENDKAKEEKFVFITSIELTKSNIAEIVESGRSRWKIENIGFNNQKNGNYDIEHVCCLNYNAMKNHYLLIQITDMIKQLFERGCSCIKELKISKKNISLILTNSFGEETILKDIIFNSHIKIRDI